MELVFVFACGLGGVCVCVCVCVCVLAGEWGEREMIENREREGFDA